MSLFSPPLSIPQESVIVIMVSSEHFVYASLSFSHCSLAPTWSPSHRIPFLTAFLDPLWVLPTGWSSQRTAPVWVLFNRMESLRDCLWAPMCHRSCLKICSYTEFSPWAPAPAWPLCRLQLSSRHLHLLCHEILHSHWWAQLWAVTRLSQSCLELAICDMELLVSFHWNHLCTHPAPKPFQYKRTARLVTLKYFNRFKL